MPFCRRDSDAAALVLKLEDQAPTPEWREPPGMLGEYVRRVKRLAAAPKQPAADQP